MNSSREEALFTLAVEKPAAERAAFLDRECSGDVELRQRVESLLQAHERSGEFLNRPPAEMPAETFMITTGIAPITEKAGDRIGRYKLLQQIGEGGCGLVYMAEQEEPVRRRVALKVIKLGMDTKSVIARFEAERQALAMMDHPNIARVLDGGVTESPLTRPSDTLSPLGGAGRGEGDAHAKSQIENQESQIPPGRPYLVMELGQGLPIPEFT